MKFYYQILFIFIPTLIRSISLPLDMDKSGKIRPFEWNLSTPLSLSIEQGNDIELFIILTNNSSIQLQKKRTKNVENLDHYTFSLPTDLQKETNKLQLQVFNNKNVWPFKSYKTSIQPKFNIPKLGLISASKTITHGGAGVVVFESELSKELSFLAFIDEKDIPFYPQTFIKNGFYAILFPWYTDYSKTWTNHYVIAMDHAGNTNILNLETIIPNIKKYRESKINLPADYVQQKAKELALSTEESKALEGNISEINKVLAQQNTFERWKETRTSFNDNIKNIIRNPTVFSKPSIPMSNAMTTATYGDQRKYYYQKKLVRSSVHRGLDFASYKNTPIYALLDGKVVYADWYGGNGKSVVIDHGFNVYSLYAHNSELLVKAGQKVKAGTQISISGTTGQSTGDHLHLSLFVQGIFIEPKEWLQKESIDQLFHKPLQDAEEYIKNL